MKITEFFEGEDGRLSMTRLIVLMTFPPATWVLLDDGDQLANYLGFYVGGYAAGKASDIFMKGNGNASSNQVVETDSYSVAVSERVSSGTPDSKPNMQIKRTRGKGRGF